jgi:hypothetical protein
MGAFRMMEAPSGSSGSAFWTVNREALHIDGEDRVKELLTDLAEGRNIPNTCIREDNIELAFLPLDLCEEAIQIAKVGPVPLYAGDIFSRSPSPPPPTPDHGAPL